MRSVGSHSTPGREKEGKEERTGQDKTGQFYLEVDFLSLPNDLLLYNFLCLFLVFFPLNIRAEPHLCD
jgi:hypothetical protein